MNNHIITRTLKGSRNLHMADCESLMTSRKKSAGFSRSSNPKPTHHITIQIILAGTGTNRLQLGLNSTRSLGNSVSGNIKKTLSSGQGLNLDPSQIHSYH